MFCFGFFFSSYLLMEIFGPTHHLLAPCSQVKEQTRTHSLSSVFTQRSRLAFQLLNFDFKSLQFEEETLSDGAN